VTKDEIKKIRAIVKTYCSKYKMESMSDDLEQMVLLKCIENPKRAQNIQRTFIDCLRQILGRFTPRFDSWKFTGEVEKKPAPTPTLDRDALLMQCVRKMDSPYREIVLLILEYGLTQSEIADIFGLSQGRISQIVHEATIELKWRTSDNFISFYSGSA